LSLAIVDGDCKFVRCMQSTLGVTHATANKTLAAGRYLSEAPRTQRLSSSIPATKFA
jgi:hypothetical protein